jgi:hypothetical protein
MLFETPWQKDDIYMNLKNGRKTPVPRHSEIKDSLCELICELIRKQLGLK